MIIFQVTMITGFIIRKWEASYNQFKLLTLLKKYKKDFYKKHHKNYFLRTSKIKLVTNYFMSKSCGFECQVRRIHNNRYLLWNLYLRNSWASTIKFHRINAFCNNNCWRVKVRLFTQIKRKVNLICIINAWRFLMIFLFV